MTQEGGRGLMGFLVVTPPFQCFFLFSKRILLFFGVKQQKDLKSKMNCVAQNREEEEESRRLFVSSALNLFAASLFFGLDDFPSLLPSFPVFPRWWRLFFRLPSSTPLTSTPLLSFWSELLKFNLIFFIVQRKPKLWT